MSMFSFPDPKLSMLGGGIVKHEEEKIKRPGVGAVVVFLFVNSIEETLEVCSFSLSRFLPLFLAAGYALFLMLRRLIRIVPLFRKSRQQEVRRLELKMPRVNMGGPRTMKIRRGMLEVCG